MKPSALLIFEINCYEYEPLVKIQWGRNLSRCFAWGRKPKKESASVWLGIATDAAAQTRVPADRERSCTKLCGPVRWKTADTLLRAMKTHFESLNIEHFERTCSDD